MTEDQAPNANQRRAWDGADGDNWVELEDWYNASSRRLTPHLFEAAAIARGEPVLDVGCGTGASTRQAARVSKTGDVLGVDLSARMIRRARERAAEDGLTNVRFEQGDAQVHPFPPDGFDVAISHFGAMFFDDLVAAFVNVARGLTRRGRVAMLCWQRLADNEWVRAIRSALAAGRVLPDPPAGAPGPFAFDDPGRIRDVLTAAGFEAVDVAAVREPLYMGAGVPRAFDAVRRLGVVRGLLGDLDEATQRRALARLRTALEAHETAEGVTFGASAWLAVAEKKGRS